MYLQLAELGRKGRSANKPSRRKIITVPQQIIRKVKPMDFYSNFKQQRQLPPPPDNYARTPLLPGVLVRADQYDDYSDEEIESEGVELSGAGRERRKKKRDGRAEAKIAKKKGKADNKQAKADKKRSKGIAKETRAEAKKDKANNPRGKFDFKKGASDVLDTASQAVSVFNQIKGGGSDSANASDSDSKPNFFTEYKTPIIIGVGLVAAALIVPKLLPKIA